MAKDDSTVYGGDTTQPDGTETKPDAGAATPDIEATVPDGSKTTADEDATVPEETLPDSGAVGAAVPQTVLIEKGGLLLHTYRVETDAIAGGMGRVWRVHHTGWNTDLAMKQPKAELFRTEEQKETFIRECDAWINLGLHPHIVSCYYVREVGGVPTIFSEWMDGGSLENSIDSGALYEGEEKEVLKRILDISLQFARGLAYAQEAGLIHQDVKPDNLLLSREGEAKVADFGIARARAVLTVSESEKTADKTMFSAGGAYTPMYCSPEQMNGDTLTRRTDVWSWAVSVLEMFMGERPWMNGVVAGMGCEDYFGMARIPVSKKMRALLGQCFEENEADRPHDFAQVIKALLDIYGEATGEEYPRARPKAAADTADSLNNRALSYLDLGKPQEAEKLWERALNTDPAHLDATYNQNLYLWRSGRITDQAAKARVNTTARGKKQGEYLLRAMEEESGETGSVGLLDGREYESKTFASTLNSALLSDDGKYALTGDRAGRVFYWSVEDGKCIHVIQAYDNTHYIYDERGNIVETVQSQQPDWDVNALQLSGNHVYSCSNQGYIKRVDLTNGRVDMEYEKQYLAILDISVSADGKYMVSAGVDDKHAVLLWSTNSKTPVRTLSAFGELRGRQNAVQFCPDNLHVLSAGFDKTLYMWNIESGRCVKKIPLKERTTCLSVSADGRFVFVGGDNRLLECYDLDSGEKVRSFEGHKYSLICLGADRTGKLISCDQEGVVRLWDAGSGVCSKTFEGIGMAGAAALSADGRKVIAGKNAFCIQVFDALPGKEAPWALSRVTASRKVLSEQEAFRAATDAATKHLENKDIQKALDAWREARNCPGHKNDAKCRALGAEIARYCRVKNIDGLLEKYVMPSHDWDVTAIALNREATLAATVGLKDIKLWDICGGVCLKTFRSPEEQANKLYFTQDEKAVICCSYGLPVCIPLDGSKPYQAAEVFLKVNNVLALLPESNRAVVLTAGGDETVCLVELATGKTVYAFENQNVKISDIDKIIPGRGGRSVYVFFNLYCDDTGTLCEYNLKTGKCLQNVPIGTENVFGISGDERFVIGLADAAIPALYELDTGRCAMRFEGHEDDVYTAALSPDGRYLFSGGYDNTLRIWDTASGECLHVIRAHTRSVSRVCITPDGRQLISGSIDETLRIWEIDCDYEFPGWADWDEGARPYLKIFLAQNPNWTDGDFDGLIADLQNCGYGWLRPEGVRAALVKMHPRKKGLFRWKK